MTRVLSVGVLGFRESGAGRKAERIHPKSVGAFEKGVSVW